MSIMGFGPQKLFGPVCQFILIESDRNRSIQFHEPHPCKIPFIKARRIGLGRAYGWHEGMFIHVEAYEGLETLDKPSLSAPFRVSTS